MARKRKIAAVVFSLGCMHASSLMALGLGELSLDSFLNEPLKAQVDLLNTGGLHEDEIRIRLATKEDFEKIGLDRAYFLTSIKFEVDTDERGQTRIVITSEDPVLEPYLDFIIEARWPSGRLLREYTVLVDPPVFDQSTPVISASKRVEEVEGIPAPGKKKPQVDSSGTRVDVRKSDLGPGEMPQRKFNAEASTTPMAGARYMIRRDDTLWEVAQQARPEGVSVHQTMLDIQRLNPEAFIDGNINRVKAGYIVYLPDSGDISSADLASALAEVRQQNDAWREGLASQPVSGGGPSLRISAEPEPAAATGTEAAASAGSSTGSMEEMDKAQRDRAEMEQRLLSMQEQVETLQRIVNVKDDQISALQQQLGEDGVSGEPGELIGEPEDSAGLAAEAEAVEAVGEAMPAAEEIAQLESVTEVESQEPAAETPPAAPEAKPEPKPEPKPVTPAVQPENGGMMSYLLYALGAAVVAILAFVFMRRRREQDEDEELFADTDSAFAEVELQDQQLAVEASAEPEEEAAEPESEEEIETLIEEAKRGEPGSDDQGYGEQKHDEYASDVDEVDALAEADIYIAYGRYPQAIDLLKNAMGTEPGNPAYRLKLLELHADMGDRDAALQQFSELKSINDPASLVRAEALLAGIGAAAPDLDAGSATKVSPLDLLSESDEPLEASFSGLEIEEGPLVEGVAEDLDLSADFDDSQLNQEVQDDDLVIAAESNGFSTKLDLARAYLDMGDDDGARQILEEVAAEGAGELKTEALELLERIG